MSAAENFGIVIKPHEGCVHVNTMSDTLITVVVTLTSSAISADNPEATDAGRVNFSTFSFLCLHISSYFFLLEIRDTLKEKGSNTKTNCTFCVSSYPLPLFTVYAD